MKENNSYLKQVMQSTKETDKKTEDYTCVNMYRVLWGHRTAGMHTGMGSDRIRKGLLEEEEQDDNNS